MSKAVKMLDEIKNKLPRRGPKPLVERLPPDLYAEMLEVRTAWRAGKLERAATKTALGHLLADGLSRRGISIAQETVRRWLTAND